MIKVANNLQNLAIKQASIRDELVMWIPGVTGIGGGLAAASLSEGNLPITLGASLLGSLAGMPISYLLSSDKQKKRIKRNPAEGIGSIGLVF